MLTDRQNKLLFDWLLNSVDILQALLPYEKEPNKAYCNFVMTDSTCRGIAQNSRKQRKTLTMDLMAKFAPPVAYKTFDFDYIDGVVSIHVVLFDDSFVKLSYNAA